MINSDLLLLPDMSYIKGSDMLSKLPTYDINSVNSGYISYPERFSLEFSHTSDDNEKFIVINIEFTSENPDSIASVNKLGYNEYIGYDDV
jgi:hypothetical protein